VSVTQQRLTHATIETRGATASYDPANSSYRLRVCSQSAGAMRDNAIAVMNIPKEKLRVITEDVGGAFGMKTGAYPEYIAQLVGAKIARRPVHWMASRSESFLNDAHARDTVTQAELALDDNGRFLALRVRHVANLGVEPYLFADAGLGQATQLVDARVDPRLFYHHLAGLNVVESAFQTR